MDDREGGKEEPVRINFVKENYSRGTEVLPTTHT